MAKIFVGLAIAILLVFTLCSIALAASPQDIYNDYADNGKLDHHYTRAELEAYLNDAALHQYGDPDVIGPLDDLVKDMLAGTEETFPFTGYDWMLGLGAAVVLVAGGLALRRLGSKA